MDKIPLNYEASEGDTHKQVTSELPSEVVQCLENARFVRILLPIATSRQLADWSIAISYTLRHVRKMSPKCLS
jgi:hypothetical protein